MISDRDERFGFAIWSTDHHPDCEDKSQIPTSRRDVRCPVLVVYGRQVPIPLETSAAVAGALKAGLIVLDDCGRAPYVEQQAALFGAVRGFLDRTPPTPA